MIYLMQLVNSLNKADKALFFALFTDFKNETIEMGYENNEVELFNEMLSNHFGIEIADKRQLSKMVEIVLNERKFKALKNTLDIMR